MACSSKKKKQTQKIITFNQIIEDDHDMLMNNVENQVFFNWSPSNAANPIVVHVVLDLNRWNTITIFNN